MKIRHSQLYILTFLRPMIFNFVNFFYKLGQDLKKKQFSLYHFIAYELLILNIRFLKGLVYFPGDILNSV
jgi:hypothetical protein